MSLVHYNLNPELGKSAIWQIDEAFSFFKNELNLTDDQIEKKTPKQKLEWLCSRYLFKRLENINPNNIKKDVNGKPYCNCEAFSHHLSISHSNGYAAVATHTEEVGIDVQTFVPKIYRIKKKYTTDREINLYSTGYDEMTVLHIIWTIKESVFKLYGRKELPFIEGIVLDSTEMKKGHIITYGTLRKLDLARPFIALSLLTDEFCFSKAVYK